MLIWVLWPELGVVALALGVFMLVVWIGWMALIASVGDDLD